MIIFRGELRHRDPATQTPAQEVRSAAGWAASALGSPGRIGQFPAMKAQTPAAKVGIIFLGLLVAFVIAWAAVDLRQRAMRGIPDHDSAMYAFGDLMFGVAVFGVAA